MADRINILKGVLLIHQGKRDKMLNRVGDRMHMHEGWDFMGPEWNRNWDRVHVDIERLEREIFELSIDVDAGDDMYWAGVEEVMELEESPEFYDDKASTDDILTGVQYDIDGKME